MYAPASKSKKVAVIGGGPAGMEAAMVARNRGHEVTLFEKSGELGGQLKHTNYADFKWPIKDFKDYLIRKMDKLNVKVMLSTDADKTMLESMGFDEIIVAIGPSMNVPPIPGADSDNVYHAADVFGYEKDLAKTCVVIGGSETGVDTGLYLAKSGHTVYVLCRQANLVSDTPHAHCRTMIRGAFVREENFHDICGVKRYISIHPDGVSYIDSEGNEQKLEAGSVVLATGVNTQPEECAKFYGAAPIVHFAGDCYRIGDIRNAVSAGFGAASLI